MNSVCEERLTTPRLRHSSSSSSSSISDGSSRSRPKNTSKKIPELSRTTWKVTEAVYDFKRFPSVDQEIKGIVTAARNFGGGGFSDLKPGGGGRPDGGAKRQVSR
jgi:hypothetical protein